MADNTTTQAPPTKGVGFNLNETRGIRELLCPTENTSSWVNEKKIRRLFLQASAQQWFAPNQIDFSAPMTYNEEQRVAWARLMTVFYTLEKMGLNVISNMMGKAVHRLRSEETAYYLSVQLNDEARHVFAIEAYLQKLGMPPKYDRNFHILGQAASMGFYRVENWLFSTLFSESFASAFLRHSKTSQIDTMGADMCKYLAIDESRHLHFLHIVLPDILEKMSLVGKTYVRASQFFIMKLSMLMAHRLDKHAKAVGLDREAVIADVFENVQRSYEGFGVTRRFLRFPKITPTVYSHG